MQYSLSRGEDNKALVKLSERFEQAMVYAIHLHADQARKGSGIPYISHLLGVTALVIEAGGDEDQAIAALLHDAIEDQGGLKTLAEVRSRFGARVAKIVEGCSDSFVIPKPPWKERKENYLLHLKTIPAETRLVSLADKVHNARSILVDISSIGVEVWERFNGGREGTLWYYQELAKMFRLTGSDYLTSELERLVVEMHHITKTTLQPQDICKKNETA